MSTRAIIKCRIWLCGSLATIEFAILDMLGRISGKSFGQLIGEIHNPKIAVYQANGTAAYHLN